MSTVLVTGASGYLGRHCLPLLANMGLEVHAVATRSSPGTTPPAVRWHRVDLLDPAQRRMLINRVRPSHLLHLAWYAVPGRFWTAPENSIWLDASVGLLGDFVSAGGRRVVVAGSCAEYDWSEGICTEATTRLAPVTAYGAAKHALQTKLASFSSAFDLGSAWGRIFYTYGPGEQCERLVPSVIRALLAGIPALCTHGQQVRDFLHVADVAGAFVSLLNSTATGTFNIGSGNPVAVRDVVNLIGAKLGGTNLLRFGALPARDQEPPLLVANVDRLHNALDWRPTFDLDRGLDNAIAWWKSEMANGVEQL